MRHHPLDDQHRSKDCHLPQNKNLSMRLHYDLCRTSCLLTYLTFYTGNSLHIHIWAIFIFFYPLPPPPLAPKVTGNSSSKERGLRDGFKKKVNGSGPSQPAPLMEQGLRRTRKLRQCTNWKVNLQICKLAKASSKENWCVQLVRPADPSSWSV